MNLAHEVRLKKHRILCDFAIFSFVRRNEKLREKEQNYLNWPGVDLNPGFQNDLVSVPD